LLVAQESRTALRIGLHDLSELIRFHHCSPPRHQHDDPVRRYLAIETLQPTDLAIASDHPCLDEMTVVQWDREGDDT